VPGAHLVNEADPSPSATETVGEVGPVCTSVCTPPDAATLEAAIARLTRALATADDDTIADLVSERRAMREELRGLRETVADVVNLDAERARRER